jgi:F-type H+-transporting ATPase subunit b
MDESRAEAMKKTAAAKQEGAVATEKKVAKADAAIQAKLSKAEEKIRASRDEALASIESVAAELAQDITGKVAGISVSRDDAAKAVKAALANV